jgi:NADH-quinone oxidoreductase subunit C
MTGPAAVEPSSDAAALRERFGEAIERVTVSCGDTIVHVARERIHAVLAFLKNDPDLHYDYLTDVTAVDWRDPEKPLEVVWQLRSLPRRRDLRVKVLLAEDALVVPTVTDLWAGAEWLEREVFDMFGVRFEGHRDLRRILMWETYGEGHPLRKSFPLRGHFSRAEQTRQALAANPEAHYSLEELSLAEAYHDLPEDMRARLESGERGMVK